MNLISEKEAARILGCSVHKLQRDRRTGLSTLGFYKIGRSVKYSAEEIRDHIQKNRFSNTAQYKEAKQ